MAKVQKVVRTYSNGWTCTTEKLSEVLRKGYKVVMCNKISDSNGNEFLDYIVEKDDADMGKEAE